ncbi:Uncharacterised protein [Escherichia coli]|uniref:Uncharacterized protein n=1 Tax=Escherichia coli TaxID=562 RepID=A0A376WX25_ECOLX|nr:Uncharacterised protein [Escherichia coli]
MSSSCNSGSNLSASNALRVDSRPRQDAEIAPDRGDNEKQAENGIGELVVVFVKVLFAEVKRGPRNVTLFHLF